MATIDKYDIRKIERALEELYALGEAERTSAERELLSTAIVALINLDPTSFN